MISSFGLRNLKCLVSSQDFFISTLSNLLFSIIQLKSSFFAVDPGRAIWLIRERYRNLEYFRNEIRIPLLQTRSAFPIPLVD